MTAKQGWTFEEGDEIAPGRRAVHRLGGGTRSEAWVAWDERLHAVVVVKLLRPDQVDDADARGALAREAAALDTLQHPAIVRMFDAVLEGPRPHLVLESLDGPRLSSLVRRYGPLAPEQVVPLGIELAWALAYMHAVAYVHLDVKPRNVIVAASPRLIDLGVARRSSELANQSSAVGTPAYMAPEQARLDTALGPPADVWALGAVLHTAATARHPWQSRLDAGEAQPQLDVPPEPLDARVPQAIQRVISACLAADPAGRPTAEEVGAELEPLLPGSRRVARRRLRARSR
jgi:eukaryotic-like serine/threonine-protein kinase